MPTLLRKKSVLAAKIEATPGSEESVLTADTQLNVFDLEMNPDKEFLKRPSQYSFGGMKGVVQAGKGSAKFKIELSPGATSTPPKWATVFLTACGCSAAGGIYTPKSEAPGTNVKTITLVRYQDGLKKVLYGAVGNPVFTFQAGDVVMIEFTFTGKWKAVVADVVMLAHTAEPAKPLRWAGSGLLIGGYAYKVAQMSLDFGNVVTLREDSADSTGFYAGIITDRQATGTMDAESVLVATKDNYGIWEAGTEQALTTTMSDGTNAVNIQAPKLQFTNLQDGDRNGILVDNVTFQLNKNAEAGDDDFLIDFQAD